MFFIPFDNSIIFNERLLLPWYFFNRHVLAFFEISVLTEVCILHYLRNNSIAEIKFQKKLS